MCLKFVRSRDKVVGLLIVRLTCTLLQGGWKVDSRLWSFYSRRLKPSIDELQPSDKHPLREPSSSVLRRLSGDVSDSSYLVDPASSHMLVSKIKPCMSKYKQICTVKLRMAH